MSIKPKIETTLTRRDFMKLAGVGVGGLLLRWGLGLLGLTAVATTTNACTPFESSAQPGSVEFSQPAVASEEVIKVNGVDRYKIQKIDVRSLRASVSGALTDEQKQVSENANTYLDSMDHVLNVQESDGQGNWTDTMTSGSVGARQIVADMTLIYAVFPNRATTDNLVPPSNFNQTKDQYVHGQITRILFNNTKSIEQRLQELGNYIDLGSTGLGGMKLNGDPNDPRTMVDYVISDLQRVEQSYKELPGCTPVSLAYDVLMADLDAIGGATAAGMPIYGNRPETSNFIFVPKVSRTGENNESVKSQFEKMFTSITDNTLSRPRVFLVESTENGGDPAKVNQAMTVYYNDRDQRNRMPTIPGEVGDGTNTALYQEISPSDLPADVVATAQGGTITHVYELRQDRVRYAYAPTTGNRDNGNDGFLAPAVFFDQYDEDGKMILAGFGGDLFNKFSKVLVLGEDNARHRYDVRHKDWISDVTAKIDAYKQTGVSELFWFGLIPAMDALRNRILRGRAGSSTGLSLRSAALIPQAPQLEDILAGLYMEGDVRRRWGVAVDDVTIVNLKNPTDTSKHVPESRGDYYNMPQLKDFAGTIWVLFNQGSVTNTAIGNRVQDIEDKVICMSQANDLKETLELLGKITPWALMVVAALLEPAVIGAGLDGLLQFLSGGALPLIFAAAADAPSLDNQRAQLEYGVWTHQVFNPIKEPDSRTAWIPQDIQRAII